MSYPSQQVITHAVIPAAGLGVRLKPLTSIAPKEMLPLGCKPAAQHIIEELQAVGVTDITFVISRNKASIREYFGDNTCNGTINLRYVIQEEQRGLADAILQAEKAVDGKRFIVALGDTVMVSEEPVQPLARLIDICCKQDAFTGICVEEVPLKNAFRYGMVRPTSDSCEWGFKIDLAVEKPDINHCPGKYAIGGRYVFDAGIFELIRRTKPGTGGEQQITDSIMLGISEGQSTWCAHLFKDEYRYDIGNFEVYCEAFTAICLRDKNLAPSVLKAVHAIIPESPDSTDDPVNCAK